MSAILLGVVSGGPPRASGTSRPSQTASPRRVGIGSDVTPPLRPTAPTPVLCDAVCTVVSPPGSPVPAMHGMLCAVRRAGLWPSAPPWPAQCWEYGESVQLCVNGSARAGQGSHGQRAQERCKGSVRLLVVQSGRALYSTVEQCYKLAGGVLCSLFTSVAPLPHSAVCCTCWLLEGADQIPTQLLLVNAGP